MYEDVSLSTPILAFASKKHTFRIVLWVWTNPLVLLRKYLEVYY